MFFPLLPTFRKKETEAYEIIVLSVCPSVCHTVITFSQFLYFHDIQQGGRSIEGDNAIIFNLVVSTVPEWLMFSLSRWMQNLHKSMWEHEALRSVTVENTQFPCDS
jgi:predicted Co/Zn/Cd cation transporter (cation efflux family)